jgi:Leucine-rich repeat (LRR) protein
LSIRGGGIDFLNGTVFDNITELQTLEIEDNRLSEIDRDILGKLPKLKQLRLPGNALARELAYPFTNTELEVLDLSRNQFNRLTDDELMSLPNLIKFDMSGNIISDMQTTPFTGLSSLEELIFSDNVIATLPNYVFAPLTSIRTIKFDRNKITQINNNVFYNLNTLEDLTLADNMLSSLPDTTFSGCTSLSTLDLSNNMFDQVPTEALRSANNLYFINMDQNIIQNLDAESFARITALEEIKLSHLPSLLSVEEKVFFLLNQLETINMTNNPYLSVIHPEAFHSASLGSLKNLYLSNNALKVIEQQWFMDKYALEYAEVYGNQLHCSCEARWVRFFHYNFFYYTVDSC